MCKLCNKPNKPYYHRAYKGSTLNVFIDAVIDYTGEPPCKSKYNSWKSDQTRDIDNYIISSLQVAYSKKFYTHNQITMARFRLFGKGNGQKRVHTEGDKIKQKAYRDKNIHSSYVSHGIQKYWNDATGIVRFRVTLKVNNKRGSKAFNTINEAIVYRDKLIR